MNTPTVENAHVALEVLHEQLARESNVGADFLFGIEVFTPASAGAALAALDNIRVTSAASRRALFDARQACQAAYLSTPAAA